jgi:hypothetical protein
MPIYPQAPRPVPAPSPTAPGVTPQMGGGGGEVVPGLQHLLREGYCCDCCSIAVVGIVSTVATTAQAAITAITAIASISSRKG